MFFDECIPLCQPVGEGLLEAFALGAYFGGDGAGGVGVGGGLEGVDFRQADFHSLDFRLQGLDARFQRGELLGSFAAEVGLRAAGVLAVGLRQLDGGASVILLWLKKFSPMGQPQRQNCKREIVLWVSMESQWQCFRI